MSLNRASQSKVTIATICSGLPCSISSVSIYNEPHSGILVKSYAYFNLPKASLFHFNRFDIWWAPIRNPSQNLWLFEFAHVFLSWFLVFWYIIGPNLPSLFKKQRVPLMKKIHGLQALHVATLSCCRLHLPRASLFDFESFNILWASIGLPSKKLWPFVFPLGFLISFWAFWDDKPQLGIPIKSCGYWNLCRASFFYF